MAVEVAEQARAPAVLVEEETVLALITELLEL
jgi:hypothetical protein